MSLHAVRPKILGFISEDASAWLVAALTLLAGGFFTLLLVMATREQYQHQLQQRFELLASERFSRIEERFEDQAQRLDSLRRFFLNSDSVTREDFDGFTQPLLRRTQAYSWAPIVSGAERAAFEQHVQGEGLTDFSIRELTAQGTLEVAGQRAEYVPVLFSQALNPLGTVLGYDLQAQPLRRSTLERARASAAMAVSQPITLIGVQPAFARGMLLVAAVNLPASATRPTSEPYGYVMAVISMRQLLADGLPEVHLDNLVVQITDLSVGDTHEVLYASANTPADSPLSAMRPMSLGDHEYRVQMRPSQAFLAANHASIGTPLLLGGLLSLLLSILLYNLVSQRQRALRLVQQRTAELGLREQELRGTHSQLRSVLNAATEVAIIATDLRGVISTFNAGAEQMLGYRSADVVGQLTLQALHLEDELRLRAELLSRRQGKPIAVSQAMLVETDSDGHEALEWTLVRQDGSHLSVNMLATPVLDEQGLWVGHLAICIDITERKRIHEALAARDRLLEKLSAHVPGGIYQYTQSTDGSARFVYASAGTGDLFEVDTRLLQENAEPAFARLHPQDLGRVRLSIQASAQYLSPWREEFRVQLPRHGLRWLRGEATPERQANGDVLWHGYLSDISDLKRVEEELRALSVTDALTGVYNRRYFQERLKVELARVQRDLSSLAVIMLDIDHFKRINDQYGHAEGDRVLKELCQRVTQRLRCTDVFCRLGGEEFMVLCSNTDAEQACSLALELWQGLRGQPFEGVGVVSASFGIASWRPGEGADALLLRADSGVYAAKQDGRDRVMAELD